MIYGNVFLTGLRFRAYIGFLMGILDCFTFAERKPEVQLSCIAGDLQWLGEVNDEKGGKGSDV